MTPERVREHARAFNAAVRSGDWDPFVATFTDDAVMRFVGVPAGPFVGRPAIAEAYATQPPTDTLAVDEVATEADVDVVRFRWDSGGTGTLTIRWRDGRVADLTVAFD
jgi:steroid delta-isomerase